MRPSRRLSSERLLLPRGWAAPALLVVVLAATFCGLLGQRYANDTSAGRLDKALDSRLRARLAPATPVMDVLVHVGDAPVVAVLTAALALWCLWRQRPRAALLTGSTVAIASALTEWVLKPLVHRTEDRPWLRIHGRAHPDSPAFTYPSGHTTGVFALAVCVVLVLLAASRGSRPAAFAQLLLAAVALGLAVAVAVSVVALHRHYSTDAAGGAAVAVAVVLLGAVIIDRDKGLAKVTGR